MSDTQDPIARLVAIRSAASPSFSLDGERLFHLADDSGLPQLWVQDLVGGARRQLSFHDERVTFLARAPNADAVIYGTDTGGDERQQLHLLPAGGAARPLTEAPETMHRWGAFAPDGRRIAFTANARNGVDFDLHVMDLDDGGTRCLAPLDGLQAVAAWSPDGRSIAVIGERSHFDHELRLVDASSGAVRRIGGAEGRARYAALRWRKDGSGFFCLTELGGEHLAVAFCELAGASFRPVFASPDGDLDSLAAAPAGDLLAVTLNRQGWSELLLVDPAAGTARPVAGLPPGVVADLAWARDGRRLAFSLTAPRLPRELWLLELAAAQARRVGPPRKDTVEVPLAEWRLVAFPTFDGRQLPAWLALPDGAPPRAGRKAVVWVHGGPESQTRPIFRPDMQALTAHGYAVLMPNVRGSTGYGRSFAALDDRRRRLDAVDDLRHAHAWLAAQSGIDGRAIAVMGQSYGGYMVLATLARHPELWKAAIDNYGLADFLSFLRDTGRWRWRHRAAEYGDPEGDADFLREASPLAQIAQFRAPLLVTHGLRDPVVPPSESLALVARLRELGKPVELLTFAHEGHGYVRPDDRRAALRAYVDFLARCL